MRELVFLIGAQSSHFGSVHLRAIQLEELVREALHQRGFNSSVIRGLPRPADATYFVTKSFALDFGVAGFDEIAAQGGEIIFDPLDMKMGEDFRELALRSTLLVASSLTQRDHFSAAFGNDVRVAFIPHHVDTRLPEVRGQMERFRIAYIGAPANAKLPRRKKWFQFTDWRTRFTDICDVMDASRYDDTGWMRALGNYNCHYLFREKQSFDGFKPFLKGYVAAHCGAVVMAQRDDAEAVANLGADYPYLFDIRRGRDIVDCVERV
ncbi:hypothetical protein, partial [Parvibaculum sp.]|uniref:hypothetical protein n=1 Tax=Parvibaculum sp. TaxID=2024848 RepID=UPI00320FD135